MKKKLYTFTERLLIAAFTLIAMVAIAIGISAMAVSDTPDMDANGNGTVEIADAVLLARVVAEDTTLTEFRIVDPDADGLLTLHDVVCILRHLADIDPYGPGHQTTTTTTETSTTTTETSTTETTTETTITETTTTTTETTTSTTETTPTETTIFDTNDNVRKYLFMVSNKSQSTGYESYDYKQMTGFWYFVDSSGKVWCYNLLYSKDLGELYPDQLVHQPGLIAGLHIWEPTERMLWNYEDYVDYMTEFPAFDSKLPDTSNASFIATDGTTGKYNLVPWSEFNYEAMVRVAGILEGEYDVTDMDVSNYDYNLNGVVDTNDFLMAASYYHATIPAKLGVSTVPVVYATNKWEYNPKTGEYTASIG